MVGGLKGVLNDGGPIVGLFTDVKLFCPGIELGTDNGGPNEELTLASLLIGKLGFCGVELSEFREKLLDNPSFGLDLACIAADVEISEEFA